MKILDQAVNVAQRIGGQVHLRSLRDAFATLMPFFVWQDSWYSSIIPSLSLMGCFQG